MKLGFGNKGTKFYPMQRGKSLMVIGSICSWFNSTTLA